MGIATRLFSMRPLPNGNMKIEASLSARMVSPSLMRRTLHWNLLFILPRDGALMMPKPRTTCRAPPPPPKDGK
ncbi:hypothetical protein KSP40_PGU002635 [Platanthera guangdongensis]|uniref:Uncharacterized protein n=1 Tax=Platanthera guangdongensis TaxID=2320717 RepID=A0ABR2LYL2_9ASPA